MILKLGTFGMSVLLRTCPEVSKQVETASSEIPTVTQDLIFLIHQY